MVVELDRRASACLPQGTIDIRRSTRYMFVRHVAVTPNRPPAGPPYQPSSSLRLAPADVISQQTGRRSSPESLSSPTSITTRSTSKYYVLATSLNQVRQAQNPRPARCRARSVHVKPTITRPYRSKVITFTHAMSVQIQTTVLSR